MSEPVIIRIDPDIAEVALQKAVACATAAARERVYVSQSVALSIQAELEAQTGLTTADGRSEIVGLLDLLDVCDFRLNGWTIEVRVVSRLKRPGLYVPTMPILVGALADAYIAAEVDDRMSKVTILGFARPVEFGVAELSPNGLIAILDLDQLQPFEEIVRQVQIANVEVADCEAFDDWLRRANRIQESVMSMLAADGALTDAEIARLTNLIHDEVLRTYGGRLPEGGLAPLLRQLLRRFGLKAPIPARPGSILAYDFPHEGQSRPEVERQRLDYARGDLDVRDRVAFYQHLLHDDAARERVLYSEAALDLASRGQHRMKARQRRYRRRENSIRAGTHFLGPPLRDSEAGTKEIVVEELASVKQNDIIRGVLFPEPIKVLIAEAFGDKTKLIGTGVESGKTYERLLDAAQLANLVVSPEAVSFHGDPSRFRLGVEAIRLGLAYEFDPYFALSIARVDPLPHQLEAVYEYFLKLPRIRFLLADDPGAGKTIMAGLLLKELKVRGLVKRTLIVTPASLSFQWQREMKDKFREDFSIIRGDTLRNQYGQNPWQERDQVITSISWVSRVQDAKESLLRSHWDLIVVDEAHKMSATRADSPTLAYELGQKLSQMTDHFLLMTATPHKGDPDHFRRFLELIDREVYESSGSIEEALARRSAPFYLRRVKEALVNFPDPETGQVTKIFTRRNVETTTFDLTGPELELYDELTNYVEDQSIKAAQDDSARGRVLAFTMAMLQRRFASSVYAMRRSLERMRDKRQKILDDPEAHRRALIERRLPDDFEDLDEEERAEILDDLESAVASVDPAALRVEISRLDKLADRARNVEQREVESKLTKLKEVLSQHNVFSDPKMKLLVFTEHKDTLDYLVQKLTEWGLTVAKIHGGMKVGDRDTPGSRIHAEREFRETAQVLVATEAAGEGINLQFCWFMINYDIPWNPVRLEQRMGRIHRYGQEKDCLIVNFVSRSTREGRVLEKLFERIRKIEADLDPERTGKIFNVLGDVFPANELERLVREMYSHSLTEAALKSRIVEQVDTDHFRRVTSSALEGLAKRELNLQAIMGKRSEAVERRLVPEVVEDFFTAAAPIVGVTARKDQRHPHIYRSGRMPAALFSVGAQLEPRYGRLSRDYGRIIFDKELLKQDATLEWVTPGHPLFEVVREESLRRVREDLQHGAIFFDLHSSEPYLLDVFTATISDGNGNTLHKRLFAVQTDLKGESAVTQSTIFFDLSVAPPGTQVDAALSAIDRSTAERALVTIAMDPFLLEVATERRRETDIIKRHVEISLKEISHKLNLQYAEMIGLRESGEGDQGLEGRISMLETRKDEVDERLERRLRDLQRERECAIGDIQHVGRAWVLPHPERNAPSMASMVRDEDVERTAVEIAIAYERERGCEVEDVQAENRGFDLISRRYHPEDPKTAVEVRFIEVKGRAGVGEVALTTNEFRKAEVVKNDYWLYAVFNCASTPELHLVQDPARLGWKPITRVEHFLLSSTDLLEAES